MRLFIAIELDDSVKALLAEAAMQLARQASSGNFVPRENFHITLVFIGETKRTDEAKAIMRRVASAEAKGPLQLALDGVGSFNSGRKQKSGHTWWVGVEKHPALVRLANLLASELRSAGYDIEKRPLRPHVTLGRSVVTNKPVGVEFPRQSVTATKISLLKSDLSGSRLGKAPVYTRIAAASLP
jgi:2'-5' RNA ligase